MHAGGDDRSPLAGLSGYSSTVHTYIMRIVIPAEVLYNSVTDLSEVKEFRCRIMNFS